MKALEYLLLGVGIAFALSLIWMLLTQCLSKIAVWVALILAAALLLVTAIIFFVASGDHLAEGQGWAIVLGIVCVLLMLLIIYYACFHANQIKACAAFIQIGARCIK